MKKAILLPFLATIVFFSLSAPAPASTRPERGDLWIQTALESVLEQDGHFDLDHIGISTDQGLVTLSGMVLTGDEKGRAELLAMQIPGVKAVKNEMMVVPAMTRDVEKEKLSRSALIENPLLHIRDLRVRADDGTITLKGIVYHGGEKRLAKALVIMLPGVKNVINKIEVLRQA